MGKSKRGKKEAGHLHVWQGTDKGGIKIVKKIPKPVATSEESLAEFVCTKKGKLTMGAINGAMEKAGDALIATAQRLADIQSYKGEGD